MAIGGMIGGGIFIGARRHHRARGHLAFAVFLLGGCAGAHRTRVRSPRPTRGPRGWAVHLPARRGPHPTGRRVALVARRRLRRRARRLRLHLRPLPADVLGAAALVARGAGSPSSPPSARSTCAAQPRRRTEDGGGGQSPDQLAVIAGIGLIGVTCSRRAPQPPRQRGLSGVFLGAAVDLRRLRGLRTAALRLRRHRQPGGPCRARSTSRCVGHRDLRRGHSGPRCSCRIRRSSPNGGRLRRPSARSARNVRPMGWQPAPRLLATSSAINATLFSTARLVRDVSNAHQAPPALGAPCETFPQPQCGCSQSVGAAFACCPASTSSLPSDQRRSSACSRWSTTFTPARPSARPNESSATSGRSPAQRRSSSSSLSWPSTIRLRLALIAGCLLSIGRRSGCCSTFQPGHPTLTRRPDRVSDSGYLLHQK